MRAGRPARHRGGVFTAGLLACTFSLVAVACGGSDGSDDRADADTTETASDQQTESTDRGGDDGGSLDLGDPCTVLTAEEAAAVAGMPMPGELRQELDMTAMYEAWAEIAGADVDLDGATAACVRASVELDPEAESQALPPGEVALSPSIATLTKGAFDFDTMVDGISDVSDELGVPAGMEVRAEDEVMVTVSIFVDDTHLISLFGGKGGASEAEATELVMAAASIVAAKL